MIRIDSTITKTGDRSINPSSPHDLGHVPSPGSLLGTIYLKMNPSGGSPILEKFTGKKPRSNIEFRDRT